MFKCTRSSCATLCDTGQEAAHGAVMRLLDPRSCGRDGHLKQCIYMLPSMYVDLTDIL